MKLNILQAFSVKKTITGKEVYFVNIIIEKDAAAYIKRHSKDNAVALYIHAAGGG